MRGPSSVKPSGENPSSASLMIRLWRLLIEPSPKIQEPDQRRQVTLLSGFLIGTILLAIIIELLTIALIQWENYTGYRQTIVNVVLLSIIYGISRTHRVRLAALLAVIVATIGVYVSGWAEPRSVVSGLFDFMILPLWLGSLYLSLSGLTILVIGVLVALLLFPLVSPQVSLNDILVGPFSFIFTTSILLIVITRHRNKLEQDRRVELAEKEKFSRREAARAEALLRVASRLNAEHDLDTLLQALGEEVAQALNTSVSIVMLYDEKQRMLFPSSGVGIPLEDIKGIPPFPRDGYERTVKNLGPVFALQNTKDFRNFSYIKEFTRLNLTSLTFATMEYRGELIGSLNAITSGEERNFTSDELLLLQGIADQAALAITNTRLYKDARRRLEHLQALRAIDIAISSNHNLRETLKVLLDQIMGQLRVDAAVILLLDESKGVLDFGASRGFQTSALRYTSLKLGQGMAGRAAQQHQIIHIQDLKADPKALVDAPLLAKEGFVSYYAAPLITQGQVKGVMEIFHCSLLDPDTEWLDFLETLAGQAAIAIDNTTLFDDLQRTNDELSKAYDATIEGWSHALDLRDKETEGHTLRVTELTLELARMFGFNDSDLSHIRRGALLHDIGKLGVPDRILFKEGPLTEDEWEIMRKHPVHAHEMLLPIEYLRPAIDIPYCHHEKWDGTGYPRGLGGEMIPLVARLFAVVDVWDALTSDRPYRSAWSPEKVLAHIRDGAGTHFDPHVVEVFVKLMEQKSQAGLL